MKKSVHRITTNMMLLFAVLMLAGFAPQDEAARDMEELSRAIVKEDAEGLRKFGFDKEKVRRMEAECLKRELEVAKVVSNENIVPAVPEVAGAADDDLGVQDRKSVV